MKKYDLSHVRFLGSGAAPLSAELTQQLVKVMPNAQIGQAYGTSVTPWLAGFLDKVLMFYFA